MTQPCKSDFDRWLDRVVLPTTGIRATSTNNGEPAVFIPTSLAAELRRLARLITQAESGQVKLTPAAAEYAMRTFARALRDLRYAMHNAEKGKAQ